MISEKKQWRFKAVWFDCTIQNEFHVNYLEQVELFCIVDIPHTCLISKQASSNTYYRTRNRFLVISALQPEKHNSAFQVSMRFTEAKVNGNRAQRGNKTTK